MEKLLTMENPVFRCFLFYAGLVIAKTWLMTILTMKNRVTHGIFMNTEDVAAFNDGKGQPVMADERVDRIRRCHRNDLENVLPFVLIGFLYISTDPAPGLAMFLFRAFAVLRCLYTLCYLVPLPQPSRTLMFMGGWVVTATMTVMVIFSGSL